MRGSSRWFKQVVIAVAMLMLLTSAWPGVAQTEKPIIIPQQEVNPKERFWSGDLLILPEAVSAAVKQPAPQLPSAVMADWVYLIYQSYRDGNWEIYLAHDGQEFRLTNNTASDARPRLNYDATQIAFNSNRDGNYEIYTMNISGSNLRRLTFNAVSDSAPAWSPDGTKIAFMSNRDGNYEIYVMNADGSGQTRLTYSSSTNDVTPTWSPDGGQIAWVQEQGTYGLISVMNADGSGYYPVGGSQPYLADVQWSPAANRFAFDYVPRPNYFPASGIYVVNTNGSGLRRAFDSGNMWVDYWAGSWSPDAINLMYTRVEYVVQNNQVYIGAAYIEANGVDSWSSAPPRYTSSGLDMNPDWQLADRVAPSSRVNILPSWSKGDTVTITWSGSDSGPSGLNSYDVQYRENVDNPAGVWTNWQMLTQQTLANFAGQYGRTYCFRSRARDNAGNTEDYPGGNSDLVGGIGDALTTLYHSMLSGNVLNNRDHPVAATRVQPNTPAINNGVSQHNGQYDLYFVAGGVYSLSVAQFNFGVLPTLEQVAVNDISVAPTLYLPPLDDQLGDRHFESGTLSAWNPTGDLTPTITSTAHTGSYAALLGGIVPSTTVNSGPYLSTIEQTITVPLTLTDGTLSLLYQIKSASPLSDTLNVYVSGAINSLTYTLPITTSAWAHHWFDVSAWNEPTATVQIELATPDKNRPVAILIDEVTWGSSIIGSHPIYLPIIRR